MVSAKRKINIAGELLEFNSPAIMGIINLTADSFYDGGKIKTDTDLLDKVEKMLSEGATILDVGAYSSRPGAKDIPVEQEMNNAVAGVKAILKEFPQAVISIDTFRAGVAESVVDAGAKIVNDISAGHLDPDMVKMVAKLKVPYIIMHMRGNPRTMMELTEYDNLVSDIIDYFNERIEVLTQMGVADVIIDPGFGFAKTRDQNFELLNELDALKALDKLILCGVSRKSMIWKSLEITADEALNGTTALNMLSLMKGASILRVHDVKEALETIKLFELTVNQE